MAKTASALICLLALLPAAAAAAAEPLPAAQGLVANATSTVQTAASQTTAAVEAAPRTVSATVQSTTSNVQTATKTLGGAVTAVEDAAPVAQPATPITRITAPPTSGTRSTATRESPGANAVGRAADAISGTKPVALASVDGDGAALRDVTSPLVLAGLPNREARPAAAASSAPARSGGDGPDTHDGPGGVTGGISGPFGFVLIAAVLAGIFLMAPRFIGRTLHMTSWRPRSAALALPIEWPD